MPSRRHAMPPHHAPGRAAPFVRRLFDVRGYAMNNERDGATHLWARTAASAARLRVSSVTLDYDWAADVSV